MSKLPDIELVKLAAAGDSDAFEQLLERHYMFIYKVAFKWVGTKEDAEDIAQNVCIKLSNNIHIFGFKSAFTTWLYRLTINTAKDFIRSASNKNKKAKLSSEGNGPEEVYSNQEDSYFAAQLLQAINELPEKFRDVALLVFAEGKTHAETAEILECKEGTISWRASEVRKKLQQYVGSKEHG